MVDYCNGKRDEKNSINDDLELLFDLNVFHPYFLQTMEDVQTYFLPRLTEEELELVENKDFTYFASFERSFDDLIGGGPDVEEAEMKASESNSKFVLAKCYRRTYIIEPERRPPDGPPKFEELDMPWARTFI